MTRQLPGKLGTSPDTSPAARPDVAAAIAKQLPPAPVVKAKAPNADGTDSNGHTPGYDLSVARLAARFNAAPVFGRPPAAAWRGDAMAQLAAEQLAGVKKASAASRAPAEADPTGALRSVANLKRRIEGAGPAPVRHVVRKAAGAALVAVYSVPDRKLLGVVDEGKLRDKAKAGDEVVLDGREGRWFVKAEDIQPLKSAQSSGQAGPASGQSELERRSQNPPPGQPVQKAARMGLAVRIMLEFGRRPAGVAARAPVAKSLQPATYDRLLTAGYQWVASSEGRRRRVNKYLAEFTTPSERTELRHELQRVGVR